MKCLLRNDDLNITNLCAMTISLSAAMLSNVSAQTTSKEIIREVQSAFLPAQSAQCKLSVVSFRVNAQSGEDTRIAEKAADIVRDGTRWWVKGTRLSVSSSGLQKSELRGSFEYLNDNHLANIEWVGGASSAAPNSFTASFQEDTILAEPGYLTISDCALVFGYSPNHLNRTLVQVMESLPTTSPLVLTPTADGLEARFSDAQGRMAVSMTHAKGRLVISSVDIIKGPNDELSRKKVREWTGSRHGLAEKMAEFHQHIGPIKWSNDFTNITSYEVRNSSQYESGKKVEERRLLIVSDFRSLSPIEHRKLMITSKIPEGTIVEVREMPHIPHEWRDGKIQKVLDMSAPEKMSDIRFEQPTPPLFTVSRILIGLSIVLGIGSAGWLIYRRART